METLYPDSLHTVTDGKTPSYLNEKHGGQGTTEQADLHARAEALRNPNSEMLIKVADTYISELSHLVPDGTRVVLGGSLASNTAIRGHNDIDLKVLLLPGQDSDSDVLAASEKIAEVVPLEKDFAVTNSGYEHFASKHKISGFITDIEGQTNIDVVVVSAQGRVGLAEQQSAIPMPILDEYVIYKTQTIDNEKFYRKIKRQFYGMSRWLHTQGYMSESLSPEQKEQLLNEAKAIFWGGSLEEILAKPE